LFYRDILFLAVYYFPSGYFVYYLHVPRGKSPQTNNVIVFNDDILAGLGAFIFAAFEGTDCVMREIPILSPFLKFLKHYVHSAEFRKFKKTLRRNPNDHGLRTKFAKYCLLHCFTQTAVMESHRVEAIHQFEMIVKSDVFDPEIYYLMGRFCQRSDNQKAKEVYLEGIRSFNRYIEKNPGLREEYMETTLAIALNLLTLQNARIDPELEKFFKYIRKSYPLHVKRVELENEMEKKEPNLTRVRQLVEEARQIKTDNDEVRAKRRQQS
jgi:hypothetical protein